MSTPDRPLRRLAKALGTFHNISYYAPEMTSFADLGLPEYWRAYMAYRSAPMGAVPSSVATSTFYNFAPQRVAEGLPSAWDTTDPAQVLELRDRSIQTALYRALPDHDVDQVLSAGGLALSAILSCEAGARPLFGAHCELDVPPDPLMQLWFAATLWREHRGDGHNIALAAESIDGIECHVLLAAKGVADRSVIGKIRGWSDVQWDQAHDRLVRRGLIDQQGAFTPEGEQLRVDIEDLTDDLASAPWVALGGSGTDAVLAVVEPLVDQLVSSGSVAGRWPPPKPPR